MCPTDPPEGVFSGMSILARFMDKLWGLGICVEYSEPGFGIERSVVTRPAER